MTTSTCTQCRGTGWIDAEGGVVRCPCRKQRAASRPQLSAREKAELSIAATRASQKLGAMPDYPNGLDQPARDGVADQLAAMCSTPDEIEWVYRRAIALFRSWKQCGAPGLRQILCSKFRARDGIESGPAAISEGYPEGIPSEQDGLTGYQLAEGATKQFLIPASNGTKLLPAGAITRDPTFDTAVQGLADAKRMPAPVPPPAEPITQADIDMAQRRRHNGIIVSGAHAEITLPPPPIPPEKQITQADIEAELHRRHSGNTSTTTPSEPAAPPDGGGGTAAATQKGMAH